MRPEAPEAFRHPGGKAIAKGRPFALQDGPAFEAVLLVQMVAAGIGNGEEPAVGITQGFAQWGIQPRKAQRKTLLYFALHARGGRHGG